MENSPSGFRGAMFGGFSRQDVLQYLDTTHKRHNEELEAVTAERDEARKRAAELEAALTEQGRELADWRARGEDAGGLSERNRALSDRTETLGGEVARLEAEVVRLSEQNRALTETAQAYDDMRLHIADIELSAHRRADVTLHEAKVRAALIESHTDALLQENESALAVLRDRSAAAVAEARHGVNTLLAATERFGEIFDDTLGQMAALRAPEPGEAE